MHLARLAASVVGLVTTAFVNKQCCCGNQLTGTEARGLFMNPSWRDGSLQTFCEHVITTYMYMYKLSYGERVDYRLLVIVDVLLEVLGYISHT